MECETEINQEPFLIASKEEGSEGLVFTLVVDRKSSPGIESIFAEDVMSRIICNVVFSNSFPRPFIFSAERTGVAIFRKELNLARNRLVEEMGRADQKADLRELLFKAYQNYPEPAKNNVEFTRQLEDWKKEKFHRQKHLKFWKILRILSGANMS